MMLEGYDLPPEYDEDGVLVDEHPSRTPGWDYTGGGGTGRMPRHTPAPRPPARIRTKDQLEARLGYTVNAQEWADWSRREQQGLPHPPWPTKNQRVVKQTASTVVQALLIGPPVLFVGYWVIWFLLQMFVFRTCPTVECGH